MPIVAEPRRFRFGEISVGIQQREFLTDRESVLDHAIFVGRADRNIGVGEASGPSRQKEQKVSPVRSA